jgi:hypothetical protein
MSITEVLRPTDSLATAQAHAGHENPATTRAYLDDPADLQGRATAALDDESSENPAAPHEGGEQH